MQPRAQGAIEYLLIIGAAILVVAVVVIALSGMLFSAQDNTTNTSTQSGFDPLKNLAGKLFEEGSTYSVVMTIPSGKTLTDTFPDAGEGTTVTANGTTYTKGNTTWNSYLSSGTSTTFTITPVGSFGTNTSLVTPHTVTIITTPTQPTQEVTLISPAEGETINRNDLTNSAVISYTILANVTMSQCEFYLVGADESSITVTHTNLSGNIYPLLGNMYWIEDGGLGTGYAEVICTNAETGATSTSRHTITIAG